MARNYLFGEVANFRCNIGAIRDFYESEIRSQPSKPYFDNGANYVGWAITSRDGTIHDAIQHIPLDIVATKPMATIAVQPTPLCKGPIKEVLDGLSEIGLKPFRVRVMALDDHGFEMKFHATPSAKGGVFIFRSSLTPALSLNGKSMKRSSVVTFLADGRAWFVRVDKMHRAVNEGSGAGTRAARDSGAFTIRCRLRDAAGRKDRGAISPKVVPVDRFMASGRQGAIGKQIFHSASRKIADMTAPRHEPVRNALWHYLFRRSPCLGMTRL